MIARHPDADRPLLALLDEMEAGRAGNAERKAGAMLKAMEKRDGGDAMKARSQGATEVPPSLEELGINRDQSSRWQREASVDNACAAVAVIRTDPEALLAFREAMKCVNQHDLPSDIVTGQQFETGNSRAYSLSRVQRECDPDTVAAVGGDDQAVDAPAAKIAEEGNRKRSEAAREQHTKSNPRRGETLVPDHNDPAPKRSKTNVAREARAAEIGRRYNRTEKAEHDGGKGKERSGGQTARHSEKTAEKIAKEHGVDEKTAPRRNGGHRRPLPVPAAPPGVVTVEDLLRRYAVRRRLSPRTIDLYRITLSHFGEHLGHEPTVDDLDDDIVSAFLLWRAGQSCRGRKVSPASVEKDRVQILAVWRYGARKRLVREFPDVTAWKVPKRVKPAYSADDLERLVATARAMKGNTKSTGGLPRAWWWSTLLLAAFQTGERKGGLLGLRWRDVDLERLVVTFRAETRKGGREDITRGITPALADDLRRHLGADDALVWPWTGCDTGMYPALQTLCRHADAPYFALHGIRRTSASLVARGGGDATAHLGHSSPTVTRDHYLVAEITQARAGLEFLPRIGEANKQQ